MRAEARRALEAWGAIPGRLLGAGENWVFAVRDRPWVLRLRWES